MQGIQEQRHVYYDRDLKIEAYNLSGIVQKFPNHFHDYYVIGFVEGGKRHLWCRGKEYDLASGDLILFNPRDNHYCAPINGEILDYRAVNIEVDVMQKAVQEITGKDFIPHFTQNVVYQSDITQSIGELYGAILTQAPKLKRRRPFSSFWSRCCRSTQSLSMRQTCPSRISRSKRSVTIWNSIFRKTSHWMNCSP